MKQRDIVKDYFLVIFVVMAGKLLGFARELTIAAFYGSSVETDAFFFTNGLVVSVFSIVTMGLGQAFTPLYIDVKSKIDQEAANKFTSKLIIILAFIGIVIGLIISIFPNLFISLLASGLNNEARALSVKMLRIMAPSIVLYILFSIRKCILNANHKYMVTEASGIPYSISICLITVVLFEPLGAMALPIAAISGVALQFLLVFVFSVKDYRFKITRFEKDENIKKYFLLLAPIVLGSVFDEANGLLRKSLASLMGEGAITNLNYCMTLTSLVNGVVITSISTVFFPHLIKNYTEGKKSDFITNIEKCTSIASITIIPLVVYMMMFSKQVVSIVFERGQFTADDTKIVASAFAVYIFGSILYAYRYIVRTAFYAVKDTKTPTTNELVCLVITMILNVGLVYGFNIGLESMGLSWIIAMALTTPIMVIGFNKKHFILEFKKIRNEFIKAAVATAIASSIVWLASEFIELNINKFIYVVMSFSIMLLIYITFMLVFKSETVLNIKKVILGKKGKESQ